jgi:hypothetical protein
VFGYGDDHDAVSEAGRAKSDSTVTSGIKVRYDRLNPIVADLLSEALSAAHGEPATGIDESVLSLPLAALGLLRSLHRAPHLTPKAVRRHSTLPCRGL